MSVAIWILCLQQILQTNAYSVPIFLDVSQDQGSLVKRFVSHQDYVINKYTNRFMTKRSESSITKRSDLSLYNDGNIAYYIPITVGSPPQEFNVLLDSASEHLWIPSIDCVNCRNYQYFKSNQSTTYSNTTIDARLVFGSGYVSGHWSNVNILKLKV
jgi:hypothetical protein